MAGVIRGRQAGWPWWVPVAFAAAVPAGAAWLAYERRLKARGGSPLVELSLFRERGFRLGLPLVLLFWMVTSFFLLIGLYLQDGLGYSPVAAGLLFAPLAVAFVVASLSTGKLGSIGDDRLLAIGASVAALGLVLSALIAASAGDAFPGLPLILAFVIVGAGNGCFMPTAVGAVLRRIPADAAGSASGVLSTAQQVGYALGVAGGGSAFFSELGQRSGGAAYGDALAVGTLVAIAVTVAASFLALQLRERTAAREPQAATLK